MKRNGLFIKVFSYTIVSVALLVIVTGLLFSQQFLSFYRTMQTREVVASYEPLVERIQRNDYKNIDDIAQRFHLYNQSFEFHIMDKHGDIIYATPNADTSSSFDGDFYFVVYRDLDVIIVAQSITGLDSFYKDLLVRAASIFAIMLFLCLINAYFFARQMTKPIKILADNTSKMANLEVVPPPCVRKDELGELAQDVYFMYNKLNETISKLEDELLKKRELEETKQYFFQAVSHELKTPIAATSIMLEGMLEDIGDYKDHSKYLRECVKMMDVQSKLISEILEIVRLDTGKVAPFFETFDVKRIIMEQVADYEILAKRMDLTIDVDIKSDETCISDVKMLKKVFSNVLLNAIQNTPAGGEVRVWSEVLCSRPKTLSKNNTEFSVVGNRQAERKVNFSPPATMSKCRICILNKGVRIDDKILPKLFDPFYRIDTARSRKNGNSGLGLTIVSKTLETMDIPFTLENTIAGVLFWLELPCYTGERKDIHFSPYLPVVHD